MQLFADKNLQILLFPVLIGLGIAVLLIITRAIVLKIARQNSRRVHNPIAIAILEILRIPSIYWCIAVGVYSGISVANLDVKYAKPLFQFIHILLILSITVAVGSIVVASFRQLMRNVNPRHQISGLSVGMIKGAVWLLGLSGILSVFGISLAPLLTALGVGGLAVALALKDTLENLFAGIYLVTDRSIHVGDFVRLESGHEGKIEDIGWRTTKITAAGNNMTIIPNSKLAQSIVINYCLPTKRVAVSLPFTINSVPDVNRPLDILTSLVSRASEDIVGVLSTPAPTAQFTAIGNDGTLTLQVIFFVDEFNQQFFAMSEIRKRAYEAFLRDGFTFPQRAFIPST